MPLGDTVPTGTYLDMVTALPVVDPARVLSPVLVVRGQYDGIATEEDLILFYRRLPNPDCQLVILPGASHAVTLGLTRGLLWHAMQVFLTAPVRAGPGRAARRARLSGGCAHGRLSRARKQPFVQQQNRNGRGQRNQRRGLRAGAFHQGAGQGGGAHGADQAGGDE